jgi:predicted secreted protein
MMKRKIFVLVTFALIAASLWAGDTATFVDLGFSPDGRIYMFGQYGIQSKTLKPWADLYVVDVPLNDFVSGGRISYVHNSAVVAGQDGAGALYRLTARNAAIAERYNVDYLFQGKPLYITLEDNDGEENRSSINFRDFESGVDYQASLVPFIEGSGAALKSSFYINLESTNRNGARRTYTVGTPQLKRPLIEEYTISKVMIAPRDGSMIFVIRMKKPTDTGYDIRYMVEAVRL